MQDMSTKKMNSGVSRRSSRPLRAGRQVAGVQQALLFAVGGDYSAAATGQQQSSPGARRRSAIVQSTSEGYGDNIETLGRLQRERRHTVYKMSRIRTELEKTSSPNVSINFDEKKVTLNNSDMLGEDVGRDALLEESERLKVTLKTTDATLKTLRAELSRVPTIQCERERVRNSATIDDFIDDIFTSVREGDLPSLKVRIAALHLEPTCSVTLTDLIEESSQLPILHVALMCDQHDIIPFLIEHGGADLTTQNIASEDSFNLSPFCIALLHGNVEAVRLILESLPDFTERAKMINRIAGYKDHNGILREELPLFCAITGCMEEISKMKKLLEYLVANGGNLEKSLTDGNTLLHLIVKHSVQKKYSSHVVYLQQFLAEVLTSVARIWWETRMETEGNPPMSMRENELQAIKHLLGIMNNEMRTPFTLAAQYESSLYTIFVQWKNIMRFPDPRLGLHFNKANTYDVTSITSINHEGYCQFSSVMNILAHNKMRLTSAGSNKEDILLTEPLKTIIMLKWLVYRWPFYIMGLLHLIHMIAFTNMVFTHETLNSTEHVEESANHTLYRNSIVWYKDHGFMHGFRFVGFLILPTVYILSEVHHTILVGMQQKFKLNSHGNGMYRVLILAFALLNWTWMLLHELYTPAAEIVVAFILMLGWIFLVFYIRGIILPFKNIQIGIFPSMVQRMFIYDVIPFLFLTLLILLAFSTAFHAILLQSEFYAGKVTSYKETIYLMVKYLCGLPNPMDSRPEEHDIIPKVLLVFYGLITTVLLINMLIAAMNRSYELIRDAKFSPLCRQRLSILMLFEQRLPKVLSRLTLKNYTILMNPRTGKHEMFLKIMDSD